jgi:hypothetical protein
VLVFFKTVTTNVVLFRNFLSDLTSRLHKGCVSDIVCSTILRSYLLGLVAHVVIQNFSRNHVQRVQVDYFGGLSYTFVFVKLVCCLSPYHITRHFGLFKVKLY